MEIIIRTSVPVPFVNKSPMYSSCFHPLTPRHSLHCLAWSIEDHAHLQGRTKRQTLMSWREVRSVDSQIGCNPTSIFLRLWYRLYWLSAPFSPYRVRLSRFAEVTAVGIPPPYTEPRNRRNRSLSERLGVMLHCDACHQEPVKADPTASLVSGYRGRCESLLELSYHFRRQGESETE